jgi:hypothetical protein
MQGDINHYKRKRTSKCELKARRVFRRDGEIKPLPLTSVQDKSVHSLKQSEGMYVMTLFHQMLLAMVNLITTTIIAYLRTYMLKEF